MATWRRASISATPGRSRDLVTPAESDRRPRAPRLLGGRAAGGRGVDRGGGRLGGELGLGGLDAGEEGEEVLAEDLLDLRLGVAAAQQLVRDPGKERDVVEADRRVG